LPEVRPEAGGENGECESAGEIEEGNQRARNLSGVASPADGTTEISLETSSAERETDCPRHNSRRSAPIEQAELKKPGFFEKAGLLGHAHGRFENATIP